MIKSRIRKFVGPTMWHRIKSALGREQLDEVVLIHELLLFRGASGLMIDVGAHHGSSLDLFAADQWKVFAFEPDPKNRAILKDACKEKWSVEIDARVVSDQDELELPFYTSDVSSGISSLTAFHNSHKATLKVKTVTLRSFIAERHITHVDFLKVDTEGHDLFVLKGLPWQGVDPDVILCEFEDRKTEQHQYDFHHLARFLQDHGYNLLISEWYPVTEYGTKHRWRQFHNYPCQLRDAGAWGNIIAVRDTNLMDRLSSLSLEHSRKFAELGL